MVPFCYEHGEGASTFMLPDGRGGHYCPRCSRVPKAPEASEHAIKLAKKYNYIVKDVIGSMGSDAADEYGIVISRTHLSKAHFDLWEEMKASGLLSIIPLRRGSSSDVVNEPEAAAFTFNTDTGEIDWLGKKGSLDDDLE